MNCSTTTASQVIVVRMMGYFSLKKMTSWFEVASIESQTEGLAMAVGRHGSQPSLWRRLRRYGSKSRDRVHSLKWIHDYIYVKILAGIGSPHWRALLTLEHLRPVHLLGSWCWEWRRLMPVCPISCPRLHLTFLETMRSALHPVGHWVPRAEPTCLSTPRRPRKAKTFRVRSSPTPTQIKLQPAPTILG
jgi:hypothetical protein